MDRLLRVYRTVNLLSFDVAAGAVISALYFSKLLNVVPGAYSIITLGLTVWIIYTTDRLLDVRNLKGPAITERHEFHLRYQRRLWVSIILTGMMVAVLALFLRPSILFGGLFLAVIIGVYLGLQKYLRVKEFVIAILYTIGILLPSLGSHSSLTSSTYLLIAQFFIVSILNLLLFSLLECESDIHRGSSSFVIVYGKTLTSRVVWMLCFSSILITGWLLVQSHAYSSLIFLVMTFILMIIYLFPVYFTVNSRYRFVGDAVFFIPLIGIIL